MTPSMVSTTVTPSAVATGAYIENGEVFWWLRSPGSSKTTSAHTRTNGAIDYVGEDATVRGGPAARHVAGCGSGGVSALMISGAP